MAIGTDAKEAFALALEGMLSEMPLDKVRVNELCRRAGATPPTFYYYFRDKYELAAWMFVGDFAAGYADREPVYDVDVMEASIARFEERRGFYTAVWTDRSQNSVSAYVQEFCVEMSREAAAATGMPLDERGVLLSKYHAYGMTNLVMEWLAGGVPATRSMLADILVERTPGFLRDAMSRHAWSSGALLARAQRPAPGR